MPVACAIRRIHLSLFIVINLPVYMANRMANIAAVIVCAVPATSLTGSNPVAMRAGFCPIAPRSTERHYEKSVSPACMEPVS
jgi:hypothetical protein